MKVWKIFLLAGLLLIIIGSILIPLEINPKQDIWYKGENQFTEEEYSVFKRSVIEYSLDSPFAAFGAVEVIDSP